LILSAPLARFYWPDESPLGKIGYWGVQDPALAPGGSYETGWDRTYPPPRPLRVVGVVGSVSQLTMNDPPRLQYYTMGDRFPYLVVHARGDPATVLPQIRSTVEGVNPEVVVLEAAPFTQRVKAVTGATRIQLFLVGLFAAVSTIMAVLGLFGVMEYSVRQRLREMGIRMSTGATGAQVRAMVFLEGARLVAVGIGLGVLGAWASGRLLRGFLFGVVPWDPKVLAATAGVMVLVALAGCITPTRRAGRVDPVMILRAE
jgi:predicted lysophospholipase L1 biosynthesis ABC-type transport system permease subunit